MVNNWKLLTIIAKSSILYVDRFMDPTVRDYCPRFKPFLLRLDIKDPFLKQFSWFRVLLTYPSRTERFYWFHIHDIP